MTSTTRSYVPRLTAALVALAALLAGCKLSKQDASADASSSAAATAAPATGTDAPEPGTYTIKSATNGSGAASYTGTAKVAKNGSVFNIDWTIPNMPSYRGVALAYPGELAVGWGIGGEFGVVVYEIAGKKLVGKWATGRSNAVGSEEIEGPENLDGVYKIVKGQNPDGKLYTGTVTIHPAGDTYTVSWKIPNQSYDGVAIKNGSRLVVGWGVGGKGAGVVDYAVRGTTLSGRWATPGGTKLGTEVLGK